MYLGKEVLHPSQTPYAHNSRTIHRKMLAFVEFLLVRKNQQQCVITYCSLILKTLKSHLPSQLFLNFNSEL